MKRLNKCLPLFLFLYLGLFQVSAQYTSDDWKARDRWMRISEFLETTAVKSGMHVADIGAHEGYLTMHLASKVGESGRVYAVDVNQYRLGRLESHANERKLSNIRTILGDYDNPKLPENSLDMVYVLDSYHEMSFYKAMLSHFYKSLKTGGTIVLLEKMKKRKIGASREQQTEAHTLALHYVKDELQDAGFTIRKQIENYGNWERDSSKKIWILIATKP